MATEDPHGFVEVARRRKAGRARKAKNVAAAAKVPDGWGAKKAPAKKAAPAVKPATEKAGPAAKKVGG